MSEKLSESRVTVELASATREAPPIRFADLIAGLSAAREVMLRADDAEPRVDWQVRTVTGGNPFTATVEPVPDPEHRERGRRVIRRLFDLAERVEAGAYEGISRHVLVAFRELAELVDRGRLSISLHHSSASFTVRKGLSQEIRAVLAPQSTARGSVKGQLESINVHGETNVFRIYPSVGANYVDCRFAAELEPDAVAAIGRNVRAHGRLHYRARVDVPYRIDVTSIEMLPLDSELPTILDIRGLAPHATGDVPSEAFVRNLRIAREKEA